MIGLYGRQKKMDFASYMKSLNIIPVSITYEYDPNDLNKANELYQKEANGEYKKDQFEDIDTIARGIREYKGRVKLVAGEPIKEGFETAEDLAAIIDKFIWSNYELYPSSLLSSGTEDGVSSQEKEKFLQRINQYPEHLRERIKAMYAAPVKNKENSLKNV